MPAGSKGVSCEEPDTIPLFPVIVAKVIVPPNAVDVPALLPDGTPSDLSISNLLAQRGDVQEIKRYSLEGLPKLDGEDKK